MSFIYIRNITIADPKSSLNRQKLDLFIRDGVVELAKKSAEKEADITLEGEGLMISPGWCDLLSYCGEPGEEWKEDLKSLSETASAGGFTTIAAFCGNHPYPDKSTAITSIARRAQHLNADILPLGTATRRREGKEMAEIFDMKTAGAVAFTDGDNPIVHSGLRARIMEYAANSNAVFIDIPFDPSLAAHGTMHDGKTSNSLGLKGIPSLAEINELSASLKLAGWLKVPVRFAGISTAESVELIRAARKKGIDVMAAVPVMNLLYTDSSLETFDENFKVQPPLRLESDRQALLDGLSDGTLSAVYSNHHPQDSESKNVEFEYAAAGAITLQTVFSMLRQSMGDAFNSDIAIHSLVHGPRQFLGLESPSVEEGKAGNFTVFSADQNWILNQQNNKSKSKNSTEFNKKLTGRVEGTIYNGEWNPVNYSVAQK